MKNEYTTFRKQTDPMLLGCYKWTNSHVEMDENEYDKPGQIESSSCVHQKLLF